MDSDERQQHRRDRLAAAAAKCGGKAALGRLLGYKDGAFVGQMLRGERPVTEDTVEKLEAKPSFRAWFSTDNYQREVTEPSVDYSGAQFLSALEHDVLHALRVLPLDEQQEIANDLMHRAERLTQAVERLLAQRGMPVTGFASATRAAEHLPPAPQTEAPQRGRLHEDKAAPRLQAPTRRVK
jgi:hypothetical protein